MTPTLRRAGFLALSVLLVVFAMVSVAGAQDGDASCYPVPPGGCEPDDEVDCEELVAAIEAEDPAADLNGDGVVDESDLPAECQEQEPQPTEDPTEEPTEDPTTDPAGTEDPVDCEALVEQVEAGELDASELPAGCEEIQVSDEGGAEEDVAADDAGDDGEAAVLADTGAPAAGLAALAALGLLGGAVLLRVGRRA